MPRMHWGPGLRSGPRWGSSRRSPRPPSRLGRGTPPPQAPHPPRRLRRLDPRAFGACCSAQSEQKPIKNFGKSSRGRSQGLTKIFRAPVTHTYGASRGHLCDSSAFLFHIVPVTFCTSDHLILQYMLTD